jgi:hypothetical protein
MGRRCAEENGTYCPEDRSCGETITALCRHIEKLEAEVARLTQEQETLKSWQPMETAPKDGTNVLVCWHDGATASMFAVGHNLGDGRRWQNTHDWLHNERSWPTHWMPVPDPPAALASLPQEGTK